ncbi:hypothetical protein GGTG_13466 [Gaeumannomyces tritici R3-111a-1]|uniref:C2H2-type domain-containing protein n=1 Tax=Gaeumannomyces tritici (strain R3-111a-1) TaxID=644352 RepID=J3PIY6_GAET3|nr:hypothetical protein GGTG_13466 [Gaeumannomyces tritici R3-111a-1]EJT68960.1 hypothetical protein GGTG_13466 [Gaeumannomyces tritici R3-111a-1]
MSDVTIHEARELFRLKASYGAQDVQKAYYAAARKHHPDANGGVTGNLGKLAEARRVLLGALQNPATDDVALRNPATDDVVAPASQCPVEKCNYKSHDMQDHLSEFHLFELCTGACALDFDSLIKQCEHMNEFHPLGECRLCNRSICIEFMQWHLREDHKCGYDLQEGAYDNAVGQDINVINAFWESRKEEDEATGIVTCIVTKCKDQIGMESLHNHLFTKHGWQKCKVCRDVLGPPDDKELKSHMKKHPICGECHTLFKDRDALNTHLVDEHRYKECTHQYCISYFPPDELDRHINSEHPRCSVCGVRMDFRELPSHLRRKHGWETCIVCHEPYDPSVDHYKLHPGHQPPPQQAPPQQPSQQPSQQPPQQQGPPQQQSRPRQRGRPQQQGPPPQPPLSQQDRVAEPPKRGDSNGGRAGTRASKRRKVSPQPRNNPQQEADNGGCAEGVGIPPKKSPITTILRHQPDKQRKYSFRLRVRRKDNKEVWEQERFIQQQYPDLLYNYWKQKGGRPHVARYRVFKVLRCLENGEYLVQWEGYSDADKETTEKTLVELKDIAKEELRKFEEGRKAESPIVLD